MPSTYSLFATAPKGIEPLLAEELTQLGARDAKQTRGGVSFSGDLCLAYRACLWSRLANRLLLRLADIPAPDTDALYAGTRELDWAAQLSPGATLAVGVTAVGSPIAHTRFAAQRVKDGIVDRLREDTGARPDVDLKHPDLRVQVHLHGEQATVSLDLSGESLHRRGYRALGVAAPLKENLAAAILRRAGWPAIAAGGGALVDPMCGSGTLLIEGALMAADIAPGLQRERYGFLGWRGHDTTAWAELVEEARQRRAAGLSHLPRILGFDADRQAVRAAHENIEGAGLHGHVHVERRDLADASAPPAPTGLVVVNPPYGERLGEAQTLAPLYNALGTLLRERFTGWQAAVFTGNPELGKQIGIRARRLHALYNGPIPCKLLRFEIDPKWVMGADRPGTASSSPDAETLPEGARMFANRLRKNLKALRRWSEREGVSCYRLYDADMPEYALAVDLYQGAERWVHVQEYAAPRGIDPAAAQRRLREALQALPAVLDLPPANIFFKVRRRQPGKQQYTKLAERGRFHEVNEGPCRLLVNFTDYLDTGLFLDHRPTRALIRESARGKRFLNLFAYTGAATVHAAVGGARRTTSVDLSGTYLDWARRNLALNGFSTERHALVQADVFEWLQDQAGRHRYDMIFLDPPTFSTSKRMRGTLDIQRDHPGLIAMAAELLAAGGVLLFSTNFRRFRLDEEALAGLHVEDITAATIPHDFRRNPRIHRCWRIRRGDS